MSSTNRSNARDTHIADYYKTPVPSIMDFLMEFFSDYPEYSFDGKFILDPCAGGRIFPYQSMSYPESIGKYAYAVEPSITTMDIRNDSLANIKGNFLKPINSIRVNHYDIIITNPPFNIAREVIEKSLQIVKPSGLVIMLLRLNFFGSQDRFKFWDKNMPDACYVHSKRPKFLETKSTDSCEYMHAVWVKGNSNKFTKLRVI